MTRTATATTTADTFVIITCRGSPWSRPTPRCARKLVEQAVQYAQGLGFAPHPDYKKAARVFGGLRAKQCSQKFTFGHEGKPFYRRGPRETEEQARRIVSHLQQLDRVPRKCWPCACKRRFSTGSDKRSIGRPSSSDDAPLQRA